MVHSFQLIVVATFAVLLRQSQGQTATTENNFLWKKINVFPVCFEARGNKPGELTHFSSDVLVGAMKLVHVSGTVRCSPNPAYDSRWGCNNVPASQYPLNVIITDKYNNIVYPLQKNIAKGNPGLWYKLPFVHTLYSKELVFINFLDPFYFPQYSSLRIWYGEDLTDVWDYNNFGRVCVDVFIHAL